MPGGIGSWFGSLRRKKPEDAAVDGAPPPVAKNEPSPGLVVPAPAPGAADGGAMASSGFMDGGASRYRTLLQEKEMQAKMRAAGAESSAGGGGGPGTAAAQPILSPKGQKMQAAQATKVRAKRLMKELRDVKKCAAVVTDGVFDVDLHDENLFEWDVWLKKWDSDSKLAGDLKGLARAHGVGDVWVRMSFPDNFPFSPPFVRVLAPNIQGGFVLSGGAICMELLTPDGWSSAYTVEAIIHQTMSTMVKVRRFWAWSVVGSSAVACGPRATC